MAEISLQGNFVLGWGQLLRYASPIDRCVQTLGALGAMAAGVASVRKNPLYMSGIH
jgi:hypothetical protein